jgi:hypothetical protein
MQVASIDKSAECRSTQRLGVLVALRGEPHGRMRGVS